MLKKLVLLGGIVLAAVTSVSADIPQDIPMPPCTPACNGAVGVPGR